MASNTIHIISKLLTRKILMIGALLWDLALSLTHSPQNSQGGNIIPILEDKLSSER